MAANTLGRDVKWGVASDEGGLVTQNFNHTHNIDSKEVKDKQGEVVTVTTYNPTADVSISGYGTYTGGAEVGEQITLANTVTPELTNCTIITKVTVTESNEDHIKTDIEAKNYPNVIIKATPEGGA